MSRKIIFGPSPSDDSYTKFNFISWFLFTALRFTFPTAFLFNPRPNICYSCVCVDDFYRIPISAATKIEVYSKSNSCTETPFQLLSSTAAAATTQLIQCQRVKWNTSLTITRFVWFILIGVYLRCELATAKSKSRRITAGRNGGSAFYFFQFHSSI